MEDLKHKFLDSCYLDRQKAKEYQNKIAAVEQQHSFIGTTATTTRRSPAIIYPSPPPRPKPQPLPQRTIKPTQPHPQPHPPPPKPKPGAIIKPPPPKPKPTITETTIETNGVNNHLIDHVIIEEEEEDFTGSDDSDDDNAVLAAAATADNAATLDDGGGGAFTCLNPSLHHRFFSSFFHIPSPWKSFGRNLVWTRIGRIWNSNSALRAYHQGHLISPDHPSLAQPVRLVFRNLTQESLLVVSRITPESGIPHNYTPIPQQQESNIIPATTCLSSRDGLTEQDVVVRDAHVGDTFCFLRIHSRTVERAELEQDFDDMVGAYRPLSSGVNEENSEDFYESVVHLITIEQQDPWRKFQTAFQQCNPSSQNNTATTYYDEEDDDDEEEEKERRKQRERVFLEHQREDTDITSYTLHSRLVVLDTEPIDVTPKQYDATKIGGWPCFVEDNWHGHDTTLREQIERDIVAARRCLPFDVAEELMNLAPIYLNRSITYGPQSCPIEATGLKFHSSDAWLEQMGMAPEKWGAIELFETDEGYYDECEDWGEGGMFLRMMAKAFLFHCVEDGFENNDVKRCYSKAMKEGLYREVIVIANGEEALSKAYATKSAADYFAELSTAFLGGTEETELFNKWQPFNRAEIRSFDPRAFKLLQKLWEDNDSVESRNGSSNAAATAAGTRKKTPKSRMARGYPLNQYM